MRVLKQVMEKQGGADAITRACVDIARKAARTISKDVIAVRLEKNGRAVCSFISEKGTDEALVRDVINLTGSITKGIIRAIFLGDSVSVKFQAKGLKR